MFTYVVTQSFDYIPSGGGSPIVILARQDQWPGAPRREIWQLSVPTEYQIRLAHNLEFSSLRDACAAIGEAFGVDPGVVDDALVRTFRSW